MIGASFSVFLVEVKIAHRRGQERGAQCLQGIGVVPGTPGSSAPLTSQSFDSDTRESTNRLRLLACLRHYVYTAVLPLMCRVLKIAGMYVRINRQTNPALFKCMHEFHS